MLSELSGILAWALDGCAQWQQRGLAPPRLRQGCDAILAHRREVGCMRLNKVKPQQLLLGEHSYLDATDECYYIDAYEYAEQQWTKPLIFVLKQGGEKTVAATAMRVAPLLPSQWLLRYTFVPMPASSGAANGLTAMVNRLPAEDIRNLILQRGATPSSHSGWRLTPFKGLNFSLSMKRLPTQSPTLSQSLTMFSQLDLTFGPLRS